MEGDVPTIRKFMSCMEAVSGSPAAQVITDLPVEDSDFEVVSAVFAAISVLHWDGVMRLGEFQVLKDGRPLKILKE